MAYTVTNLAGMYRTSNAINSQNFTYENWHNLTWLNKNCVCECVVCVGQREREGGMWRVAA